MATCSSNMKEFDISNMDLMQSSIQNLLTEVGRLHGAFDTVVMNPPFGTKHNEGEAQRVVKLFLKKLTWGCSHLHQSLVAVRSCRRGKGRGRQQRKSSLRPKQQWKSTPRPKQQQKSSLRVRPINNGNQILDPNNNGNKVRPKQQQKSSPRPKQQWKSSSR